jgi:hypothetical protein
MKPVIFTVVRTAAGWMVKDHSDMGPFNAKEQAVDLAEGMAAAIRSNGGEAAAVVDESAYQPLSNSAVKRP